MFPEEIDLTVDFEFCLVPMNFRKTSTSEYEANTKRSGQEKRFKLEGTLKKNDFQFCQSIVRDPL